METTSGFGEDGEHTPSSGFGEDGTHTLPTGITHSSAAPK